MRYRVAYSPEADHDIDTIYEYLVTKYQDVFAATNTVVSISEKIKTLNLYPERHKFNDRYYFVKVKKYKIYYRITGDLVYIVRIFHSLQTPVLPDITPLML